MRAVEELMLEKASKSPIFEAQLARLVHFPLLNHIGYTAPQSKEQQEAVVQGQANRGEPVTEMIAGTPETMEEQ